MNTNVKEGKKGGKEGGRERERKGGGKELFSPLDLITLSLKAKC